MKKSYISLGTPLGPYTPAVKIDMEKNSMLFISGQIPMNLETGEMVQRDFAAQAKRVLENIRALLAKAHYNLSDVVKLTVYLTNLADFPTLNEEFKIFFTEPFPTRTTVQVQALPKGALLEVDAVAIRSL